MDDRPIRLLIVDDHPVVRDGLRGQLDSEPDLHVVAEAASAEEALAVLRAHAVDVVVTDLRMPGSGGVGLIRTIRAERPEIEILVLSTYDTDDDVRPALAAGARSYLLKDAARETLAAAIRATKRHAAVLAPSVSRLVATAVPAPLLSEREREVLRLVAVGRTNRQIGAALFIGEATVKTHLQHVFAKLGAADRAAAVAAGYRLGLL